MLTSLRDELAADSITTTFRRALPPRALLLGEVKITGMEIASYPSNVARIIHARLWAMLEDAHDHLIAPTLPVHDEPMPNGPHTPNS